MRIWLTTDTHFGHEKIKAYCGRPDNFEELIFKNLKANLKHDDLLIHLGDFCIGNDNSWHTRFNNSVPGKKWLIRGNHDKKSNSYYLNRGWTFVGTHVYDFLFGKRLLFSHIPVAQNGTWDYNIHGHFHNSDHRSREAELRSLYTERHLLLALEHTKYQPVLLESFIANSRKAQINKETNKFMSEDTSTPVEETASATETASEAPAAEETKTEETSAE